MAVILLLITNDFVLSNAHLTNHVSRRRNFRYSVLNSKLEYLFISVTKTGLNIFLSFAFNNQFLNVFSSSLSSQGSHKDELLGKILFSIMLFLDSTNHFLNIFAMD